MASVCPTLQFFDIETVHVLRRACLSAFGHAILSDRMAEHKSRKAKENAALINHNADLTWRQFRDGSFARKVVVWGRASSLRPCKWTSAFSYVRQA